MKKKLYRIKLAIVWILMVILAPILIPLLWIVEGENPLKPKSNLLMKYAVGKRYSEDDTINDQNERFDIMKGIAHNN